MSEYEKCSHCESPAHFWVERFDAYHCRTVATEVCKKHLAKAVKAAWATGDAPVVRDAAIHNGLN